MHERITLFSQSSLGWPPVTSFGEMGLGSKGRRVESGDALPGLDQVSIVFALYSLFCSGGLVECFKWTVFCKVSLE